MTMLSAPQGHLPSWLIAALLVHQTPCEAGSGVSGGRLLLLTFFPQVLVHMMGRPVF